MRDDLVSEDSKAYSIKKSLDSMLPLVILFLVLYLYIEFLATPEFVLYSYKAFVQYSLLLYFVVELGVLFTMYESNREFVKNHWFDIMLTVPFVTALKGLLGLKFLKSSKALKALKSGKVFKGTKLTQKLGKLVKKTRKRYQKKKRIKLLSKESIRRLRDRVPDHLQQLDLLRRSCRLFPRLHRSSKTPPCFLPIQKISDFRI